MREWMVCLLGCLACSGTQQRFTKAATTIYIRSDTDRTTVVTPAVAVAAEIARNTEVDVTYQIDAWTGASVDVTTAATPAIHEIRNEATAGATRRIGDLQLRASYRYSTEPDYRSHGAVLGGTLELAQNNTTLGVFALGSGDTVGRAGDPFFAQSLRSAGARLSLAQVIDARTVADVTLEATRLAGYQASPYRFVAIGGGGTCASDAPFCVPERVPDERSRVAVLARIRRALGSAWSAGGDYRFYADDWGIQSHAAQTDVAWRATDSGLLAARYRYYTQSDAAFYRPRYFDLMDSQHLTRDRKLSAFFSHELGVSYLHRLELNDGAHAIIGGVRSTASRIDYLAFVGLDHVYAIELTALVGLELP